MYRFSYRRALLIAAVPLTLFAFGCQQPETAAGKGAKPSAAGRKQIGERKAVNLDANEIVEAARKLGAETENPVISTDSGLQYIQIKEGDGEPAKAGDMAVVHYTGWLLDGNKFDSSLDRGTPFSFPVGAKRVILGWDEGVAGMQPGEIRKLIVSPDLGYGSRSVGPIPPDSTLVFDVELLEVQQAGQP